MNSINTNNFGTNHVSGKMHAAINFEDHAINVRGYRVVEIEEVKDTSVSGINEVIIKLKNPVNRYDQPVVTEKHLVTDKYVSSFSSVNYQG